MLKKYLILSVLALFGLIIPQTAQAQIKNVSGRILEKHIGNKGRNLPFEEEVHVLAYNTVEAARRELEKLKQPGASAIMAMDYDEEAFPDAQGYYNIRVADSGAIVVFVSQGINALEPVQGRLQIDFLIEGAIQLQGVTVTAKSPVVTVEMIPTIDTGSTLETEANITIPYHTGQNNSRLVFQPIVIDCNTGDTIYFLRPHVYDGKEYALTQERRMGFDMDHDLLEPFISGRQLTDDPFSIHFQASIKKPNVKHNYTVIAASRMNDYVKTYFADDTQITSCMARHPFQFLELNQDGYYELDPAMFRENPRNEMHEGSENISLTFPVGKTELDDNPANNEALAALKETLDEIANNPDFTLRNVVIQGFASPEGNFALNQNLARGRAQTAVRMLEGKVNARFIGFEEPEIVSWNVVADSMQAHGFTAHAAEIRSIVRQYPNNMNSQWARVRSLPYYKTEVEPYLTNLRQFTARWTYQTNRELRPRDILNYYYNNPDFREGGPRQFTHYDYWNLFNMIQSPDSEREKLYRRALRESYQYDARPWVYAGNKVAVFDMERDSFNINTLRPFIDINVNRVNVQRGGQGSPYYINLAEVVGNQAITYFYEEETDTAYHLAKMLPEEEKYFPIKRFTSVRALLFKRDKTKEEREELRTAVEYVSNSSTLNKAVMEVAQGQNAAAAATLELLPEDEPRRWYLKAVLESRANNVVASAQYLNQCFQLDKKYILIMQNDGDLTEEVKDTWETMYGLQ